MPYDDNSKKAATYRLSAETRQRVETIAKSEERSYTSVVERAIRYYFDKFFSKETER